MRETFLSLLPLPHPPSKISSSLAPKEGLILRLPLNILDERNGYPEIFSFSQALEIYRQYLLLRTVILQKKSLHNCSKFGDFLCSALFVRDQGVRDLTGC